MEYSKLIQLFIFEIILGYILQSAGSIVCLYAFSGKKIQAKPFVLLTIVNAVAVYIIRHIDKINFGVHTLLIMIVIILLGLTILKASINAVALSALITMVTITVAEVVNYFVLTMFYNQEQLDQIIKGDVNLDGKIVKALHVIPSNVFLIIVMFIIFKISRKRLKDKKIGEISEANS